MMWTFIDTWIVATGAVAALACAVLGNFLILRKMSMMGDAISHAVLPGLAVAFLFTGSRESWPMFIGAAVVGLLTALFTQSIHRFGRVEESAAMGVVFTTLFALGLILIVRAADHVDLDPGCVLYGAIELTPLDTLSLLGITLPRAFVILGAVLLINLGFMVAFYKELKLSSFDPALSTTLGYHANLLHYLLMSLVAVTTVAAFEAVGSILVIAMLIVPGATAYLLTDRLKLMIAISMVVAVLCAVLGHISAITVPTWFGYADTSTAGMMSAVGGGLFGVALLLSPRYGILSKLAGRALLNLRILREDLLGLLYRLEERGLTVHWDTVLEDLAIATASRQWWLRLAVGGLRRRGYVTGPTDAMTLTDRGREQAKGLVRTHRLWEVYIDKLTSQSGHQQHYLAEMLEHVKDPKLTTKLMETLGEVERDPQGKDIPPAD